MAPLYQRRGRPPPPPAFTKNSGYSTAGPEVEPAGGGSFDVLAMTEFAVLLGLTRKAEQKTQGTARTMTTAISHPAIAPNQVFETFVSIVQSQSRAAICVGHRANTQAWAVRREEANSIATGTTVFREVSSTMPLRRLNCKPWTVGDDLPASVRIAELPTSMPAAKYGLPQAEL